VLIHVHVAYIKNWQTLLYKTIEQIVGGTIFF